MLVPDCSHVAKHGSQSFKLTSQPSWAAPGGSSEIMTTTQAGLLSAITHKGQDWKEFYLKGLKVEGEREGEASKTQQRESCVGGEYRQRWCRPPLLWEQLRHCRYHVRRSSRMEGQIKIIIKNIDPMKTYPGRFQLKSEDVQSQTYLAHWGHVDVDHVGDELKQKTVHVR